MGDIEFSPGWPGRPGLLCMRASGGLAIHLWDSQSQEVICCGLRSTDSARWGTMAPFELNGCRRCARAAVKRGYVCVRSFEGKHIQLDGFVPFNAG